MPGISWPATVAGGLNCTCSAAVMALNFVLIGKVIQIAANRLRTDVKMFDQFFRTDITLQAHQLDNCVMTLCLLHDNPLKRLACTWLLLFVVRAMTRVPKCHQ